MKGLAKFFYKLSRAMNDLHAASTGRLGQRLIRRRVTRSAFRWFR